MSDIFFECSIDFLGVHFKMKLGETPYGSMGGGWLGYTASLGLSQADWTLGLGGAAHLLHIE